MQDPPPQPTNQPSYAPSEMFGQEQMQVYAPPAHEITQPLILAQEITIYPNRKQAIWRTIFVVVVLLIDIPFTFSYLSSLINPLPDDPASPLLRSMFVFLLILFLFLIAFTSLIIWRMASTLVFSRKPLLVINREGITVGRVPARRGFFIPWAEIEAVSSRTFMYKYPCIQPRNQREFMKRFNWWERFIRLNNSMFGIPPLIVPQVFLERPVEEIISTLYYGYANELTYYHVQLRP